jgi:trehalose synthase
MCALGASVGGGRPEVFGDGGLVCDLERPRDVSRDMFEVDISGMSPARSRSVLPAACYEAFERAMEEGSRILSGRVVWNVNSTARDGGVTELLASLVPYSRGAGADVRWVVIEGTPEYFTITNRIRHRVYGTPGDGGPLDDRVQAAYEWALANNMTELAGRVRPGDVVWDREPDRVRRQRAAARGPSRPESVRRCHVLAVARSIAGTADRSPCP